MLNITLVVKFVRMLFPLLREYFTLSGENKLDFFSYRALILAMFVSLVFCSTVTVYLTEQAKQNLTIQDNIITQFNDIVIENENLKQQLTNSQNNAFQCETRANKAMNDCQKTIATLQKKGDYVYDPKTKTMVLKPSS